MLEKILEQKFWEGYYGNFFLSLVHIFTEVCSKLGMFDEKLANPIFRNQSTLCFFSLGLVTELWLYLLNFQHFGRNID